MRFRASAVAFLLRDFRFADFFLVDFFLVAVFLVAFFVAFLAIGGSFHE